MEEKENLQEEVLEEKVEETKPEVKKVNRDVKALVLAKCLKIVVKGKPAGARFRQGGLCFVEPVSIDEIGAVNDAKLIRAGKFRKIKSFIYEMIVNGKYCCHLLSSIHTTT